MHCRVKSSSWRDSWKHIGVRICSETGRVIYGSRIGGPNDEIGIIERRGVLALLAWHFHPTISGS
jgi:hypothetical protein